MSNDVMYAVALLAPSGAPKFFQYSFKLGMVPNRQI